MTHYRDVEIDLMNIYINLKSFLKNLKNANIYENQTLVLEKYINFVYDLCQKKIQFKNEISELNSFLTMLANLLIDDFNGINRSLTYEKAEIYNRIMNLIQKINQYE